MDRRVKEILDRVAVDWRRRLSVRELAASVNLGPSRLEHLFRATLEASACGLRWIVDTLREGGVPVRRFVATGGLPHHNPLFVQICADVLGEPIVIHPCEYGPALGAAILGALGAGPQATGFGSAGAAIRAMAQPQAGQQRVVKPQRAAWRSYQRVYGQYRRLAEALRRG